MPLLDDKIVTGKLLSMPKWRLENGEMVRRCDFPNFVEAMQFVNSSCGVGRRRWAPSRHRYPLQQGAAFPGEP